MVGSISTLHQHSPDSHATQERCPWCEQPISHGRFDEISTRIAQAEQARLADQEAELRDRFAQERQQLSARARAAIEATQRSAAETVARASAEASERHTAELAATTARAEAAAAARLRIATEQAEARIGIAEAARMEAERVASERVVGFERERALLGQQLRDAKAAHEAEIAARTNEVRENMGQEMSKALLDVRAAAFAEKQKLTEAVDDLKRQLEKKTASELGEGAEIDLFVALEKRFEGDTIRRVPRGQNGADVVHEVIEHGVVCGRIVYDSKNRSSWQANFIGKLHADMIAAKADHAILSSNRFPVGAKQLHVTQGVIVAFPARVIAVAELLRSHIVQIHALRVSAEQREEKTAVLYDYITSDRYGRLMESMETAFEKLKAIDADERKAHDTVWNKRARLINELDRTRVVVAAELQKILGTGSQDMPTGEVQ